jgi:hypothetical protein
MVQFEKGSVSGHRFSDAAQRRQILNGFSSDVHFTAQRLKPCILYLRLAACLKACPVTNLVKTAPLPKVFDLFCPTAAIPV